MSRSSQQTDPLLCHACCLRATEAGHPPPRTLSLVGLPTQGNTVGTKKGLASTREGLATLCGHWLSHFPWDIGGKVAQVVLYSNPDSEEGLSYDFVARGWPFVTIIQYVLALWDSNFIFF